MMPFELQNAGETYTRMMRHVLDGMGSTENFVDDVLYHIAKGGKHISGN